jgi:hypothetical protein
MKKQLLLFFVACAMAANAATPGKDAGNRVPVLLELFTSEGCSSCPPSDLLLDKLDKTQPVPGAEIIVLSEHVDYWNGLGWRDPFSAPEFTARQRAYVKQFQIESTYTPQMVVDGQKEFVGGRAAEARDNIAQAAQHPKTPVGLTVVDHNAAKVNVTVAFDSKSGGADSIVYLALAESHVESQVGSGENSGRKLRHVAAVRTLAAAGTVKSGEAFSKQVSLNIPRGAGKNGLRVVAFVQERSSGKVIGITQLEL